MRLRICLQHPAMEKARTFLRNLPRDARGPGRNGDKTDGTFPRYRVFSATTAKEQTAEAYETLLLDCLEGDRMLFAQGDWVEAAWGLLDPLLETWAATPPDDFPNYAAGTWGPEKARQLIERDARHWHLS